MSLSTDTVLVLLYMIELRHSVDIANNRMNYHY